MAFGVSKFLTTIFQGGEFGVGFGPLDPETMVFEENEVTHSRERWEAGIQLLIDDPSLVLGGPTNQWITTTIAATWHMRTWAPKLQVPILLLQAELDTFVINAGQDWVCNHARDCKKVSFEGSFHEILFEVDSIRNPAINDHIVPFLLSHASSG